MWIDPDGEILDNWKLLVSDAIKNADKAIEELKERPVHYAYARGVKEGLVLARDLLKPFEKSRIKRRIKEGES